MTNTQDPSLRAVSLALQVTLVVPAWKNPPEVTTVSRLSVQMTLSAFTVASTTSVAFGETDQETKAPANEASTFVVSALGHVTVGPSLSAKNKPNK